MKARRAAWLVATIACLSAAVPAAAAEPSPLKSLHELARRGRYADCVAQADAALAESPNDPWFTLYRALCGGRQGPAAEFPALSREQLRAKLQDLHREERRQRRHAVQQQALDRQLKLEQKRWDRQVKSLARDVERETLRAAREAEQDAAHRARRARRVPLPSTELPFEAPLAPTPARPGSSEGQAGEPALPPQARQARPGEGGRPLEPDGDEPEAELPSVPVTVQTPPPTPSLANRARPPAGAVQIDARQMSVSPDQRVATAEGDVELVYGDAFLTCDRMTLFTDTHDVYAEGNVRLEQGAQVFRGEMAQYNFDNKKGRFLQGTVISSPWVEHGRTLEYLAEGVYEVTPGYLTSCDFEPPHYRFSGRRAIVFSEDRHARARNVALLVERMPFLYLPYVSFTERRSPFFIVPGKKKPWGPFLLSGYRYELPGEGRHHGTVKADWRDNFGWGYGIDHWFESAQAGKGLLKAYYNEKRNDEEELSGLPKGADADRYRVLWRHAWKPAPHTSVVTDFQKFSDVNFRKDFLFREEFLDNDQAESYVSSVTSTPDFNFTGLVRKRVNRFQTVDELLPQMTLDLRERRLGDSDLYTATQFDAANFETKRAHSEDDADVVRGDVLQQFKYAARFFRPVEVTPRVGTRQTYYTKDIQGGEERLQGDRDVVSGQFFTGVDTSLKVMRVFPVTTDAWGLNINRLRHIVTPTVGYTYRHNPTILNQQVNFPAAETPTNALSLGLENKLQTKRLDTNRQWQSVDLARLVASLPYTFHGTSNKQGARFGDWTFDVESSPWPWMQLESDLSWPSHFDRRLRESRVTAWNTDLVVVGGQGMLDAAHAHDVAAPDPVAFRPGPVGGVHFLPRGQWYLGAGHRYSHNDKTEAVVQWDWRLSEKWQVGAFHRYTFKEVVSGQKRFNNLREFQYNVRRDLHDWVGELVYRVDREYGDEVFFTLTLKAFPDMPIEMETSYHQPKPGSQSSVFSPVAR